ncbi:MAG: glycosyltransferase family 2 protein [Ignavibacteriota bacterium]
MVEVSIIIVNYNGFNLLKKCLSTLYQFSSGLSFEVILIDNNSTEGDIKDAIKEFENLILIKNETNLGFSRANNIGLKIAKGKYVLFLNNDVFFTENTLIKIFDFAEQHDENAFIGCKLLNTDNSWQPSFAKFPSALNLFTSNFFLYKFFPSSPRFNKYYLQKSDVKFPINVDYILGAFLFGQKDVLLELNGFDERFFFYAEDIDLCYRLNLIGGETIFYPHTSVIHVGGASVKSNQWFKFKNKAVSELQFFQKHKTGLEYLVGILSHYMGNLIRIPISFVLGIILFDSRMMNRSYYHLKLLFVYPKNIFK